MVVAYLRDTLSPLATAENSPRDLAGILALEEKRLGLSVLETEDLAVRADEELALLYVSARVLSIYCDQYPSESRSMRLGVDPCR